ncbi:transcription termination factor 1-like isoform X2 [Hyla sarda]|uniref:transcription termination factor 1-like isoform X2 n=1 Tax=Hyla sarda TaxID=327740 RepID=UPI0024C2C033|nr:transcription termination factor 1-like isoform X2 [Hyla sarda]
MINLNIMYMGSGEGMPKRKKRKVNSENQEVEGDPIIPNRKSDGYIEKAPDRETYKKKKKKRKDESHQDDPSSSSIVLHQECNEKIKKPHKAKNSERLHRDELFTEETPCRENTDQEGESKEKKRKKTKKDSRERLLDNSLMKDLSAVQTHHTKKKRKKRKDGGDLQSDGFTEEGDDQSERSVKKRKEESHLEADDIAANDASSSVVFYLEENEKIKKSQKTKDSKRLHGDEQCIEETTYSKVTDPEGRSERKIKKPMKDHGEQCLDKKLVEESSVDTQHAKKKTKGKDGGDHQEYGFTEELFTQRKSSDGKETLEQVDQSETYVKKKKKRKEEPHQETDDIAADDGAPTIVYQEKNQKIKKSHKAKDTKRLHGDEGLPEEALYREPADITDKQSLKDKKDRLIENSLAEELLISETQQAKKKKKLKISGELKDYGFTEKFPSYRKTPDGSDAPEQVDECLDQVKKIKKKKRKHQPHQEAKDIAVEDVYSIGLHEDEPSYSEPNYTEDRPSQTKKKKSKKVLEDSSVEELLNHDAKRTNKNPELKGGRDESHRQHGFTETTEQVVETVDQTEVHVKKKVKNKKHLDRSEETSDISAQETQPEGGQSLQSRVVESDGNMRNREQTPTSGQSRPQTCASTDTDQNPATQDKCEEAQSEGDNGSATLGKNTEKVVVKRQYKMPFIREQDLALLEEYFPQLKSLSTKAVSELVHQELERVKIAKQKGIVFHSGTFTIEEDEQIKKNVQKFMSEFGIESAEMLFHPYKFPEQKNTIRKIKKTFQFTHRIAEGLHRTTKQVRFRGWVLFENFTTKGRYSEDEVRQLKKYLELHGKNWRTIGSLLDRSYLSCEIRSNLLRHDVNRGAWSKEETNRLIAAVKEFVLDCLRREKSNDEELVTVPKKNLYTGIKWVRIEEKVETRHHKFCQRKWFDIVMLRMNNGIHPFKGTLGIQNNIKMIKWMYESKVRDSRDLKWDKLCDDIGNFPRDIAQKIFLRLKQKIKDFKTKRLYEIIDVLYKEKLPELEAKLSAAEEIPVEPKKKNKFLISEIFQEWSEIDEIWSKAGSTADVGGKGGKAASKQKKTFNA